MQNYNIYALQYLLIFAVYLSFFSIANFTEKAKLTTTTIC